MAAATADAAAGKIVDAGIGRNKFGCTIIIISVFIKKFIFLQSHRKN
jgi:hypothetical protein